MSSGNQELGFAIRARNELGSSMKDAAKDLDLLDQAAKDAEAAGKDMAGTWGSLDREIQELGDSVRELSEKMDPKGNVQAYVDTFGALSQTLTGVADIADVAAEKLGLPAGPLGDWSRAAADVAGGIEGVIAGGAELVQQLGPMAAKIVPVVAGTWAHVAALLAQAAAFIVANAPILLLIGGIALLALGVLALVKNWDTIQPHVQPVIDFFQDKVVPAFVAVWEKGLKPVIDFVMDHWKLIGTLILAPFAPIILVATDAFGIRSKSIEGFQAVVDWMGDTWKTIKGKVTSPFDDLLEAAKGAFGVKDAIIGAFDAIPGAISAALSGLWDTVAGIFDPIISAYNAVAGKLHLGTLPKFGGGDGFTGTVSGAAPGGVPGAMNPSEPGYGSQSQNSEMLDRIAPPTGLAWDQQGGAWVYPWEVGNNLPGRIRDWHASPDFGQVGGAPIVIQAWDGESVETWLNRGGAEKIRKALNNSEAFA